MGFKTGGAGDNGQIVTTLSGMAGRDSILAGVTSHQVNFSAPRLNVNYAVQFSFMNLVDPFPIFLQGIVTSISVAGFTITFNAPTDTGNYFLNWSIIDETP